MIGLLALPMLSLALPRWRIELLPSLEIVNSPVKAAVPPVLPTLNAPVDSIGQVLPSGSPRVIKVELHPASQTSVGLLSFWPLPAGWLDYVSRVVIPPLLRALERLKTVDWTLVTLEFWAIGVLLVIARLAAGTYRVWRLAKTASLVKQNSWVVLTQSLAARLRLRGGVELLKSKKVALPMTWGAWRSVVMLPAEADAWPQDCRRIVLLHELAHIKRHDCLTQNLAQIACALYWFNPLVWLAMRKLHVEREVACDDQVLEVGTKASEYARHLVEIARACGIDSAGHDLPQGAVGMACSQLESRVRVILDPQARRRGLNRLSASLIGIGAVCLSSSLSVVQPWSKAAASTVRVAAGTTEQDDLRLLPEQAPSVQQASRAQPGETLAAAAAREPRKTEETREPKTVQATPEIDPQDDSQTRAQSSGLTANQLIEMKAGGVTPEFVESMRQQGFDNLTVRELTQLSLHGINADYIKQARSWGGDKLTVREIVQLKINAVTPEYISEMKQAGYDGLSARQLTGMRLQGVTPEFVETMRKAGYEKLNANQLLSLKVHGVDEAYVKEVQDWTGGKPTVNELLQLKVHGVTREFANRMKALGFDNLPVEKLTQLRVLGIDEGYIKEMRDLGFDNLTIDQLIKMRIHGVNADYVKRMRAAGFKNVSVNQMIEMRVTGIDSILLKE